MTEKKLPEAFQSLVDKYPEVWEAHEKLTIACAEAGPLNRKTAELIKIGICIGGGLQTATQRHAIMAVENGASKEEVYQTALMAMTTLGHPRAAAGWKWINDALKD